MSSWKLRLLIVFTMLAMLVALSVPAMAQVGIGSLFDEEDLEEAEAELEEREEFLQERAQLLDEFGQLLDEFGGLVDDGDFDDGIGIAGLGDDGVECDEFLVEYSLPGWPDDLWAIVDDDDLWAFINWVEGERGIVWDITCWEFDF